MGFGHSRGKKRKEKKLRKNLCQKYVFKYDNYIFLNELDQLRNN